MEAVLEATVRDTRGKNEARRTRAEGRVPAVLYGLIGGKADATAIAVEPKALTKILHSEAGANTLISLKLAGAKGDAPRVLVKDYQHGRERRCAARAREGLPARSDHAQDSARRLLSHRDGQGAARHRVDHGEGRRA